ncbi:hypothetical protein [Ectopseudomonas khazarica]|uniref:hypothetical protein n=1 Tax=Ectopseudomonas khazarica TaxID=2502979 RepID=UPI003B93F4F2
MLKTIASKAAASIDRITNLPMALVTKVLSATGTTKAITRAAAKAIRSNRPTLASIALLSPMLACCLLGMVLVASKGTWDAYARAVIIAAGAVIAVHFKSRRVSRQHQRGAACRQRATERRQWRQDQRQ